MLKSECKGYLDLMLTDFKAGFIRVKNATYGSFHVVFPLTPHREQLLSKKNYTEGGLWNEFVFEVITVNICHPRFE